MCQCLIGVGHWHFSDKDYRSLQLRVQELAFLLEKFQSSKPVIKKGCDKKN